MKGLAGLTLEILPKGNSDSDSERGWEGSWTWGLSRLGKQNTPGPQNQSGEGRQGEEKREKERPGQQEDAPELHTAAEHTECL